MPTASALCQVRPEVVRHVQMRFDVQTQTLLPCLVVHGQKIAGQKHPRVGNHEANVQIVGGFLHLLEEIVGGEVQSDSSILYAEFCCETAPNFFQCREPPGDEDQMKPACRQLPREFLAHS